MDKNDFETQVLAALTDLRKGQDKLEKDVTDIKNEQRMMNAKMDDHYSDLKEDNKILRSYLDQAFERITDTLAYDERIRKLEMQMEVVMSHR